MKLNDASLFKQQGYVAGHWVTAADNAATPVENPSTGRVIGSVPLHGYEETLSSIRAAQQAQKKWQQTTAKERAKILRNWYQLILDNGDDLAIILTTEQGKPLAEAKGEIAYAASFVEWFAEEAKRTYGEVIPSQQSQ